MDQYHLSEDQQPGSFMYMLLERKRTWDVTKPTHGPQISIYVDPSSTSTWRVPSMGTGRLLGMCGQGPMPGLISALRGLVQPELRAGSLGQCGAFPPWP